MCNETENLLASFPHQVERVYITRGDNGYNQHGHKCDKAAGVMINGDIYWLQKGGIAYPSEVREDLKLLNVTIYKDNHLGEFCWGVLDKANSFTSKKVTRISKHIEEVFDADSHYIKKCIRKDNGSIWWSAAELADKFFSA